MFFISIFPLQNTQKSNPHKGKKKRVIYIYVISGVEVEVGILNGGNRSTASSVSIGSDLSIWHRRRRRRRRKVNNYLTKKESKCKHKKRNWRENVFTGSWSTGLVSSLAGLKGGLRFGELLFGLVEDSEQRLLFIVFFVTNATPHCTIKVCLGRFRLVADASSSPPP